MYGGLVALRVLARKYEFKADVSAAGCRAHLGSGLKGVFGLGLGVTGGKTDGQSGAKRAYCQPKHALAMLQLYAGLPVVRGNS